MDDASLIKKRKPDYIWFNENPIRNRILNLVIEGKSVPEIMKELNIQERTVIYTMNHESFINKFNKRIHAMQCKLIVDKTRIQEELLTTMYNDLMTEDPDKKKLKVNNDTLLKELIKITSSKTDNVRLKIEKKVTNNTYNVPKKEIKEEDLFKKFGIEPVEYEEVNSIENEQ